MQTALRRVGQYALQKKLSHKAGRRTFLAQDLQTHTPVIVKVLQFGDACHWDELKLFKRESQILQQLQHPAIPQYIDSFEAEVEGVTSFVLVQTYIAAPSLQEIVESGELFSEAEAAAIARHLLTTLSYLHQQIPPVIHRDIKPSNVLISNPFPRVKADPNGTIEGSVYLVDFGAVQTTASKTSGTMTIVGSYGYMPLEQFLGQTTPTSDLYSLGMLILYSVTGLHPAELPEKNGRIQLQQVAENIGLSSYFTQWLSQLTEPYAQKRFSSAADALTVLRAKDGRNGYFPHLNPAVHQICIHRQPNKLQIISNSRIGTNASEAVRSTENSSVAGMFFLAIFLPICICIVYYALFLLFAAFGSTLSICLLYWYAVACIKRRKKRYYSLIAIYKKRESITESIVRKVFNVGLQIIRRRSLSHKSINFVSYRPKHALKPDSKFASFFLKGRKKWSLPSELSIHTKTGTYSLSCGNLSIEEQTWISRELEDFLGLRLQTIAHTEKDISS